MVYQDWNVGDILGRSKDGFQPVDTDERELLDDSDSEVSGILSAQNFLQQISPLGYRTS